MPLIHWTLAFENVGLGCKRNERASQLDAPIGFRGANVFD